MRKLASIRKIAEIKPIEGADNIEAVRVDGWWVVAKKSHFTKYMRRSNSHVWCNLQNKKFS